MWKIKPSWRYAEKGKMDTLEQKTEKVREQRSANCQKAEGQAVCQKSEGFTAETPGWCSQEERGTAWVMRYTSFFLSLAAK